MNTIDTEIQLLQSKYGILESNINFLLVAVVDFNNYVKNSLIPDVLEDSTNLAKTIQLVKRFCLINNCLLAEYNFWLHGKNTIPFHDKEMATKTRTGEKVHSISLDEMIKCVGGKVDKSKYKSHANTLINLDLKLHSFCSQNETYSVCLTLENLQDYFRKRVINLFSIHALTSSGGVENELEIKYFKPVNSNRTIHTSVQDLECADRSEFRIYCYSYNYFDKNNHENQNPSKFTTMYMHLYTKTAQ
jgi:hypothetical protein